MNGTPAVSGSLRNPANAAAPTWPRPIAWCRSRYGACTNTGRPVWLTCSATAASWTTSPGAGAQPRGLDTKTWIASAPTAAA
jgi:hypothetical protein